MCTKISGKFDNQKCKRLILHIWHRGKSKNKRGMPVNGYVRTRILIPVQKDQQLWRLPNVCPVGSG